MTSRKDVINIERKPSIAEEDRQCLTNARRLTSFREEMNIFTLLKLHRRLNTALSSFVHGFDVELFNVPRRLRLSSISRTTSIAGTSLPIHFFPLLPLLFPRLTRLSCIRSSPGTHPAHPVCRRMKPRQRYLDRLSFLLVHCSRLRHFVR